MATGQFSLVHRIFQALGAAALLLSASAALATGSSTVEGRTTDLNTVSLDIGGSASNETTLIYSFSARAAMKVGSVFVRVHEVSGPGEWQVELRTTASLAVARTTLQAHAWNRIDLPSPVSLERWITYHLHIAAVDPTARAAFTVLTWPFCPVSSSPNESTLDNGYVRYRVDGVETRTNHRSLLALGLVTSLDAPAHCPEHDRIDVAGFAYSRLDEVTVPAGSSAIQHLARFPSPRGLARVVLPLREVRATRVPFELRSGQNVLGSGLLLMDANGNWSGTPELPVEPTADPVELRVQAEGGSLKWPVLSVASAPLSECDPLTRGTWGGARAVASVDERPLHGQDFALQIETCNLRNGYLDRDLDGAGAGEPVRFCERAIGFSVNQLDCDDFDAERSPRHKELCDGVDNDCDGEIDEDFQLRSCLLTAGVCAGAPKVCPDEPESCQRAYGPDYQPDETLCDGLDNDCDGRVDENCDAGSAGTCNAGLNGDCAVAPDIEAQGCGCGSAGAATPSLALALLGVGVLGRRTFRRARHLPATTAFIVMLASPALVRANETMFPFAQTSCAVTTSEAIHRTAHYVFRVNRPLVFREVLVRTGNVQEGGRWQAALYVGEGTRAQELPHTRIEVELKPHQWNTIAFPSPVPTNKSTTYDLRLVGAGEKSTATLLGVSSGWPPEAPTPDLLGPWLKPGRPTGLGTGTGTMLFLLEENDDALEGCADRRRVLGNVWSAPTTGSPMPRAAQVFTVEGPIGLTRIGIRIEDESLREVRFRLVDEGGAAREGLLSNRDAPVLDRRHYSATLEEPLMLGEGRHVLRLEVDGEGRMIPWMVNHAGEVDDPCDPVARGTAGGASSYFVRDGEPELGSDASLGYAWCPLRRTLTDADQDGSFARGSYELACDAPAAPELVEDCDDNDPATGPLVPERCDGTDNDCDGRIDEGCGELSTSDPAGGCAASPGDSDAAGFAGGMVALLALARRNRTPAP